MAPTPHTFFATAAPGTEGVLRDELKALGLRRVKAQRGGVHFQGALAAGMRACLWARIPHRVLLTLGAGPAPDADRLYETARAIPWEDHLGLKRTFAVQATGTSRTLAHTGFTALKVKDAVVDRLRDRLGARPDVNPKRPDVTVVCHLHRDRAELSLDLAGDALFRRGWRRDTGEAPLKESLAAAVLALGGFDPERPLLDPMCGSGTLVIEAALLARRMAPGLGRRFGFERWPAFDDDARRAWRVLLDEATSAVRPAPAPLFGRDRDPSVLEAARANAGRAGVASDVTFEARDARSLGPLPDGCQLFANPPYGARLGGGKHLQLEGFFRGFGEAWRALPGDHPLVVLSGAPGFERAFGTRAARAHTLFNGPLETRLLTFPGRGAEAPGDPDDAAPDHA